MLDKIKISGKVRIENGSILIEGNNHFTDAMMKTIISFLGSYKSRSGSSSYTSPGPTSNWSIYLGSDTSTATTHDMTALVSPIGTSPGVEPNTKHGALSNSEPGIWRVIYTAVWDSGTVSGTLGELGLYLKTTSYFEFGKTDWYCNTGPEMVSRLASADGAFTAFTINTSEPLSVTWTIEVKLV